MLLNDLTLNNVQLPISNMLNYNFVLNLVVHMS
jgi:hypothetical protein